MVIRVYMLMSALLGERGIDILVKSTGQGNGIHKKA